jgi:hypothetical protein
VEELEPEEIEQQPQQTPESYEGLVQEEPEREVAESDYTAPDSVSEVQEDSPTVSDFKAGLKALTPKFKYDRINDLVQPAMRSRIFPDNMLDKAKITVLSLVEEYDDEKADEIPVIDLIMGVQDGLAIGYEGRGIGDILELYGAAREEEIEKLAKELS